MIVAERQCRGAIGSEGQMGEVDVAAGEDYAKLWFSTVGAGGEIQGSNGAGIEKRGDCDGGGWLDDDFEALPDEAHGGDDFGFGDAEDSGEIFAEDGECARGERGTEAVGDGVGGIDGLHGAGRDG